MEFLEREDHYLELKDDGTFVKHYSKFGHVGGQQIRIDVDPVTKIQTPTFIQVKNVIAVDKATGEVKGIKRNFDPKREILGAGQNDDILLEDVIVEAVDYPNDMQKDDGTVNYKYNKTLGKLVKKT